MGDYVSPIGHMQAYGHARRVVQVQTEVVLTWPDRDHRTIRIRDRSVEPVPVLEVGLREVGIVVGLREAPEAGLATRVVGGLALRRECMCGTYV
jgi:hypothetical protein